MVRPASTSLAAAAALTVCLHVGRLSRLSLPFPEARWRCTLAWRLCVLTSELKANHRFLQQSWHVKTKEGADFDLAKTVLT